MKKYFYLILLGTTLISAATARAQDQNTAAPDAATPAPAFKVAHVDDTQIATLRNLTPGSKLVVYLGASTAALQSDPAALKALKNWIGNGGVMAVYSDAATLFGFQLQAARQGNAQKGGQLFGRAVAAPPFGSEPLVWNMPAAANSAAAAALPDLSDDNATAPGNRLSVSDPTAFGDMTVFYHLQPGDSLLVSHPSAVPLLRVTDLAEPQTTLFASAMASYGNGWVIFVPRQIETERAQGGQFLTNLVSMGINPPLPVDISAITTTANSLSGASPNYKTLLTQLQNRLAGKWQSGAAQAQTTVNNEEAPAPGDDDDNSATTTPSASSALMPATLPVARSLALAMVNALQAAASPTPPAHAEERVASVVAIWLMQAGLQRAAADRTAADAAASKWFDEAEQIAPNSREVLFWKGVSQAESAANATLPSPQRAGAFNEASTDWTDAASATPLLTPAAVPASATTTPAAAASFGDITPAILALWAKQARLAATVTAIEPPVTTVMGRGDEAVILRHFSDDPTLRLALPSIQKLQSLSSQFGWVVPGEEVLVFPNEAQLATYATRLGPLKRDETPLASSFGRYGRVLGHRILMVSQPSEPIILPGTPPRVIQAGTAAAAIVGRMHAEVLLGALSEDGGKIPVWMQLGLMSLAGNTVTVEGDTNQVPTQELIQAGATNQLLSADQFNAGALGQNTAGIADAEALSLMTYFYQQFGPGAVMETAQRIGSGENIDDALNATTNMSEADFFKSWFTALQQNG